MTGSARVSISIVADRAQTFGPHLRRGPLGMTAAFGIMLIGACGFGREDGNDRPPPPEGIRLERIAESEQVPYSFVPALARLGDADVCILDSYAVEVLCGDRDWRDVVTVATEGGGPGEISRTVRLLSAPDGGVALVDGRNRTVTFISSSREYTASVSFPVLSPAGDISEDSLIAAYGQPFPSSEPVLQVQRFAAYSGMATETIVLGFDPAWLGSEAAMISGGVMAPDGRILARISADGVGHLGWYGPDGEFLGLVDFPSFGPVYPTPRDIEMYVEGYRMIFQRDPPDADVRRYAQEPMGRFRRGAEYRSIQIDPEGRAWVLATRPSDREGTYFELFAGSDHLGSVEVPGHVVAFQISDSLLIALVEEQSPNDAGLYPRRVDWYRIIEEPGR